MNKTFSRLSVGVGLLFALASCKKDNHSNNNSGKDPAASPAAFIDRFSSTAGHLQVRTSANGLPAANAAVNFDQGPFITTGFTPDGKVVQYYNFDIQPTVPAPIYAFYQDDSTPVRGQNNIVDVIPGDPGYNDFWQVFKVTVPAGYVANSVTSYQEIMAKGYPVQATNTLVNCPIVPNGSTASLRYEQSSAPGLTLGWYKDSVVYYFNFFEKTLTVTAGGQVPVAPIDVCFNINPNQPNGGPASGFKTVPGTVQTHNVISAIPSDPGYSPLWAVAVYDNSAFGNVKDWNSAMAAPVLVPDAGNVNCPVVNIQ
ncbi:MAG TPA: hypothetical protein VGS79_13350 [Puia sp.]|nr:hypothetical protein [Puia sp.]